MATSEAGPYARTGGLGDVMAALPSALAGLGHDVKVFMPRYGSIDADLHDLHDLGCPVDVPLADKRIRTTLDHVRERRSGVDYYFVVNHEYFDREAFYLDPETGKDYSDNDMRFAFFCRAVLEAVRRFDWVPDIVHVHDWQSALVPVYMKTVYANDRVYSGAKSVLTIHNLGYQGLFAKDRFVGLDLPEKMLYAVSGPLEFFGKINFLKGGIVLADKVTTVSERYAQEIQTDEEYGCGLQGVLDSRSADLCGILNGVDYTLWSPSRDKQIPYRYGPSNLSGKRMNRVELLNKAGLPIRERVPLVGMITRLTDQKGIDLVADGADDLFKLDLQMIILGMGDDKYHRLLKQLERRYPDKLKVYLEFNDGLAHWIQAASDIFLMPSRYEPCGLNQMYALKYGSVPLVRDTGGLADTVTDYNPELGTGNGFVFDDYSPRGLIDALERALKLFGRKQAWMKLMRIGMRQDFSWKRSAVRYAELFESLRPGAQE